MPLPGTVPRPFWGLGPTAFLNPLPHILLTVKDVIFQQQIPGSSQGAGVLGLYSKATMGYFNLHMGFIFGGDNAERNFDTAPERE